MALERLYDHLDRRWVQVKDVTPAPLSADKSYPPTRTRAEFDAIAREAKREKQNTGWAEWLYTPMGPVNVTTAS